MDWENLTVDDVRGKCFTNMPEQIYHSCPGVSRSQLVDFLKSPFKYYKKHISKEIPKKETDAFRFGTLAHWFVLEPECFDERVCYIEDMEKNASKEYKKFKASNEYKEMAKALPQGVEITSKNELKELQSIRDAIIHQSNKIVLNAISKGISEVTFFSNDPLPLKCRVDCLYQFSNGRSIIVDLKTSRDLNPYYFKREGKKYGYDVQHALYKHVLSEHNINVEQFIFLVVEKEPPFEVVSYTLPQSSIDDGYQRMMASYNDLDYVISNNAWREITHPKNPKIIELPE